MPEEIIGVSEKRGVKEVEELVHGALASATSVYKNLKDGFQPKDVLAIYSECSGPMMAALDGISEVDDELGDLEGPEKAELAIFCFNEVMDMVNTLAPGTVPNLKIIEVTFEQ